MKIPKNIKAVIFDFDGLLINSEVVWSKTDTILLQKRGFNPTKELFLKRLGTGNKGTLEIYKKEFGIDDNIEDLIKERVGIFFDLLLKDLQLMQGARELIKKLYKQKMPLAIATSGPYEGRLENILDELNVRSYFPITITGSEVKNHKPAPDIFLHTGKKLGVESSKCLVLEDAPSGILAAKSAIMTAWGVSKDKAARDAMNKAGADEVFSSLKEIEV